MSRLWKVWKVLELLLVAVLPFLWKAARPDDPVVALGEAVFYLAVLAPVLLLHANIRCTPDRLLVQWWNETRIPYDKLPLCRGLALIPFRVIILVSSRLRPFGVVLGMDAVRSGRKGILQRGSVEEEIRRHISRTEAANGR